VASLKISQESVKLKARSLDAESNLGHDCCHDEKVMELQLWQLAGRSKDVD